MCTILQAIVSYFCTKDGLLMQKRTHASSLPSFQACDISWELQYFLQKVEIL